jgi:hypothetical protein
MKITFKVRLNPLSFLLQLSLTRAQDLKQNKFVIEAEPSETVRTTATAHTAVATPG